MKQQSINNFPAKKQLSLLTEMVRTDFKLRYQNSLLGYFWSLLKPLFLFAILYTVFDKFLRLGAGVPNYALSLLLGIVLWTFFTDSVTGSMKSIVGKGNLIRKIYMPRYLIPMASVASAFINMLLSLIVVFLFLMFAPINALSLQSIVVFPLLLIELTILSLGVGFILATIFVKFRDLEYIWDVVRQALFYAVPIIYPLTRIPYENVQKILLMNPIAQIIQEARSVLTYDGTTTTSNVYSSVLIGLIPIVISVLFLLLGFRFFIKRAHTFAENV